MNVETINRKGTTRMEERKEILEAFKVILLLV
jgi:hypothetical protein